VTHDSLPLALTPLKAELWPQFNESKLIRRSVVLNQAQLIQADKCCKNGIFKNVLNGLASPQCSTSFNDNPGVHDEMIISGDAEQSAAVQSSTSDKSTNASLSGLDLSEASKTVKQVKIVRENGSKETIFNLSSHNVELKCDKNEFVIKMENKSPIKLSPMVSILNVCNEPKRKKEMRSVSKKKPAVKSSPKRFYNTRARRQTIIERLRDRSPQTATETANDQDDSSRFNRVSSIEFAGNISDGIVIKCQRNCDFQKVFSSINGMRIEWNDHVNNLHEYNQTWFGYCQTCKDFIYNVANLEDPTMLTIKLELEHLIKFHVN
jgi:hypothetical protein